MTKINTTGIVNSVNTVLDIITKLEPAVAALPQVMDLIAVAISTFSSEDKAQVEKAYEDKMAGTDAAHEETQGVLEAQAEAEPEASEDKG